MLILIMWHEISGHSKGYCLAWQGVGTGQAARMVAVQLLQYKMGNFLERVIITYVINPETSPCCLLALPTYSCSKENEGLPEERMYRQ